MNIVIALICTLVAGVANGSFALPTKNIKQWNFENIWLNYAFWSFLIIPWVIIYLLAPHVGSVYHQVPAHLIWILVIGGILFGVGQVCFAEALKMIGLGLGFVINIGLGTGLGFFLPLVIFNPGKLFTLFGLVTLIAIIFIIDGIMNWNKLGWLADKFASHDAAVLCGRYTHNAFWQEPHLIDEDDPIVGMAQHYLLCPTNHGYKTLQHLTLKDCVDYGIDGVVFHSTRTCRAFTGPQQILARSAQNKLGIPSI